MDGEERTILARLLAGQEQIQDLVCKIEGKVTKIEEKQSLHGEEIATMKGSFDYLKKDMKEDRETYMQKFDRVWNRVDNLEGKFVTIDSFQSSLLNLENKLKASFWKGLGTGLIPLLAKFLYDAMQHVK